MRHGLVAAALSLAVLMLGTGLCLLRVLTPRHRWVDLAPVALAALGALAWWATNGPVEGPVLAVFSADHGVTLSDLVALPAVLVGSVVTCDVLTAQLIARPAGRRAEGADPPAERTG